MNKNPRRVPEAAPWFVVSLASSFVPAMCSLLVKRVTSCFYSPPYQNLALLLPLLRSPLATQTLPQKELPFIAQYLISSFGFSSDRALKVSTDSHLAAIKSPRRPEVVVMFLNSIGLSDNQIKSVISSQPIILGYDVDKTLRPKVRELINCGCSDELLVQLIRYNPGVLLLKDTPSRVLFWRDLVGKGDEGLLRFIMRNPSVFTRDIDKHIVPRINLLKEYGLSNQDIQLLFWHGSRCMVKNLDSLRQTLEFIEELVTPTGSKKFLNAVKAISHINKDTIGRKVELLKKTCDWSHEELCSAFSKFPNLLACSENNIKSKMDFLIRKAGIEPSTIASYPAMFGYSLERVIIARYNVLNALKAKGLDIKCRLPNACHMSEKHFYESYVVPFEKDVPGLSQDFASATDLKGQN